MLTVHVHQEPLVTHQLGVMGMQDITDKVKDAANQTKGAVKDAAGAVKGKVRGCLPWCV